ncbi:VIR protein [Plasmodium vivax]|uniref:VIR protein n=1 Tax=Plasmodium vivax TaxID=5855 RepID=A0A1G4E753_PLAVI|nr:VIR protein [Plasmodium vivax]
MTQPTKENLEVASKPLQLNSLYEEFFKSAEKSKYDNYCNALTKYNNPHKGTQDICIKLVGFVKKIAEWKNKEESVKYCNYLQYWLYDEIKGIYKEHTKKFGEIPFSKELIDIADKVNKEVKQNYCTLKHEKDVTLDELIKRKFSHIYLKKYDEIKKNVDAKGKDKCNMYITYLKYIDALHKNYKKNDCAKLYFWSPTPNYTDCSSKHDPNKLIPLLNNCKDEGSKGGSKPNSGSLLFGWWGSSSTPSSSSRNTSVAGDVKVAGVGKDKGAQGASNNLESSAGSRGLTRSTSTRDSGNGITAAKVSDSGKAGAALPGPVSTLRTKEVFSPAPKDIPGKGALAVPSYNSGIRTDTVPVPVVDSSGTLESVSDKVDSNFYRNIIMGVAILGTIFFLFYYNMSSGLKSRFPKRKRKKKIFELNYYEEYEKELAKYDSENESLDSQSDQYHLNYQPEGDYDY